MAKAICSVCGTPVDTRYLANPSKLEDGIVDLIRRDNPQWDGKRGVCAKCREAFRAKKFLGYLETEFQKINEMEKTLVAKIARRGKISKEVNEEYEEKMTFGERIADKVAQFGGSWTFIMIFGGILVFWMFINVVPVFFKKPFDVYPFILLNLLLSTLAALQAPVIMMSQNRQAAKDRLEAQQDYEVNMMAEMEIRDLHDKMDSLRLKQWHELWLMQQRQIEILEVLQRHIAVDHGGKIAPLPSEEPPTEPSPN